MVDRQAKSKYIVVTWFFTQLGLKIPDILKVDVFLINHESIKLNEADISGHKLK